MILFAHSYYLRHDPKQLERMKPYPPLATMIAVAAVRDAGHDVALFDAMLASGTDAFRAALLEHQPTAVAIVEDNFNYVTKMCTLRMREAAIEMIAAARGAGCRVVVNGSDATDQPARYLAAGADAVVVGDVESTMLDVAGAWNDGGALDEIPGLVLPDRAGGVRLTPPRPAARDLDALAEPAWDLVDVHAYRHAWTSAHGRFSCNMVTSRGCPFGCNWCAKPLFGRRYAQRSPASVAAELRRLRDAVAPDHVWFADDIFGLTPQWLDEFAREVERRNARIPFMIQCRADLLEPAAVAALAAAGAEEVWIGVESGSQRILDAMEKGTTVDEVRTATRTLHAHGIRACWFLQLGYPGEAWDDLLATRDLVRDERPDDIGVSVAYPLPGTRFHAAVREQLGQRENWRDSGELAMLFHGTYTTTFYHALRDALHDEVRTGQVNVARWSRLAAEEPRCRSASPSLLAGD